MEPGRPPEQTPFSALSLTVLAWAGALFTWALLLGWASHTVALAVGVTVGFGSVGTLAARRVPPPAELRLGLGGFPPRFLGTLLLLVPTVLVTSEVDNLVAALLPRPELPGAAEEDAPVPRRAMQLAMLEAVIALVLLRPVVEEFFFRGVLQYKLVAAHGRRYGVLFAAGLFALTQASFGLPLGPMYGISLGLQAFLLAGIFGVVRLASGSLLASMLLHAALNGVGVLAVAFPEAVAIPGFNAEGAHTPPELLFPCLISVGLGLARAIRSARAKAPAPALPGDAGAN